MSTIPQSIAFSALPALGDDLAGGVFAGVITQPDGVTSAVSVLPDEAVSPTTFSNTLDHDEAVAWADSIGAVLPTPAIASLISTNQRAAYPEADWYWTAVPNGDSLAWACFMKTGAVQDMPKGYVMKAFAVRLITVSA